MLLAVVLLVGKGAFNFLTFQQFSRLFITVSLVFSGVYVWRYSALIFISSTRQVRRRSGPTVDGGGGVKVTPKWRKRKSGYRKHLHRDRKYKHIIQLPAHRAHTHTDKGTHRLATVFTILHKKDWSGPLLASCRLSNVTTHLNVGYNHNHVPWFYSVYVPNRDRARAQWEFWARQVVCNRIPHPNCFLISKTVKFSTKALPNSSHGAV